MIFSSNIFLFAFLPCVLLGYALLPRTGLRNVWLLAVSLLFYAWGEHFYVLLMLGSIALNYVCALLLQHWRGHVLSRVFLWIAVIANLGLLAFFKYANFVVDNVGRFLEAMGFEAIHLDPVHLPIGISFFTFQALSYVIDVYRRDAVAQKNPLNVGLYISLFPQLIAGPIVRYTDIAKGISHRCMCLNAVSHGIKRFTIGLAKKVLLANTMAKAADLFFTAEASQLSAGAAWLGLVCYTLQIYYDFSGYSDMAIGLGRVFGFRFKENFKHPYIAISVRDFWRRWHISLSTWLRDYLYVPLGGSRKGGARTYLNLAVVFLLCGLWHGAAWNFVLWGLLHGGFMVLERAGLGRVLSRMWRPLQHVYLLLVVGLAWVVFRAESLTHAAGYLGALFGMAGGSESVGIGGGWTMELFVALVVSIMAMTPLRFRVSRAIIAAERGLHPTRRAWVYVLRSGAEALLVAATLVMCAMLLASGAYNPFIYFRF